MNKCQRIMKWIEQALGVMAVIFVFTIALVGAAFLVYVLIVSREDRIGFFCAIGAIGGCLGLFYLIHCGWQWLWVQASKHCPFKDKEIIDDLDDDAFFVD